MPRSRRLASVLLLSGAVAAFAFSSAEDSGALAAELQRRELRLEQLWADYWRADYRTQQGDESVSTEPAQRAIRELLGDAALLKRLESARFDDATMERRRQLFLDEAYDSAIANDAQLIQLVQSIERDQSRQRYVVAGRRLKRAGVNNILGHERDRTLRRQAWRETQKLTKRTAARIQRAMKMRNQLARRHARREFSDFMLHRRGITRERLLALFAELRDGTEPEYRRLLERMRRDLGVEKLEPWDQEYFFSTITQDFESKLGWEDAWANVLKVTAPLGYDFRDPPVDLKIADITFGGATYPILYGREIRILMNRYKGIRFTDTLLHEVGHALHYTYNRVEPGFVLQANYPAPLDEGLGQVMALMLYRPEVATEVYGLTPEQARAMAERYRLKSLWDMRGLMADIVFELEAYKNPDQDLAALFNRIQSEYLGVEFTGSTWAYNPFYSSTPIYEQNYVLAEMVGRQVHHTLDKRFGPRWGKTAGDYLRDQFLVRGGRLTLDEIMREGTGEPLSARYLIEAMRAPDNAKP